MQTGGGSTTRPQFKVEVDVELADLRQEAVLAGVASPQPDGQSDGVIVRVMSGPSGQLPQQGSQGRRTSHPPARATPPGSRRDRAAAHRIGLERLPPAERFVEMVRRLAARLLDRDATLRGQLA